MAYGRLLGLSGLTLVFAAGCGSSESSAKQGSEGQPCYPNGACNAGLVCASKLCVVLPVTDGGKDAASGGGSNTGGGGTSGAAGNASGGGGADASGTDAGQDASKPPPCDLITQTGCGTGEKCTWVRTSTTLGSEVGKIACALDGNVDVNGGCQFASNAAGGYDDCRKGEICDAPPNVDMAQGTCRAICDSKAASGTSGACPTNYACLTYGGLWNLATVGLCNPTCNPLTQTRDYDGAAACGSSDSGSPSMGCYGLPNGPFTCALAGPGTNTSDYVLGSGGVYLNACAPGYAPLLVQSSGSSNPICVAYCQPGPTSKESPANAAGLVNSGYTCPDKGAGGTHECRYWWDLEDPTKPSTAQSNTLGYCFDYTKYTYFDQTLGNLPDPSCTQISSTDPSYGNWGCAPK